MNTRPSVLYGIENKLVSFYFDRGIHWWGIFVDNSMAEAEARVRKSFKNQKGSEVFINSERTKTMNRLLGVKDSTAGYKVYKTNKPKPKARQQHSSMNPNLFTG